jgi:hypothetical protein
MAETWIIDARELAGLRDASPAALRRRWGDTLEAVAFTQDLLRTPRLAEILAKIDALLPVGARLSVDCVELSDRGAAFRRSAPQIQYALGCLFAGAYELVERKGAVQTFVKRADRRQYADSLSGLSVSVITDGRNLETLLRLCEVATLDAPLPVELLVCGPIERLQPLKERCPAVMDVVVTPMESRLIYKARMFGRVVVCGYEMSLQQAARQFELYTGKPAPLQNMEESLRQLLRNGA